MCVFFLIFFVEEFGVGAQAESFFFGGEISGLGVLNSCSWPGVSQAWRGVPDFQGHSVRHSWGHFMPKGPEKLLVSPQAEHRREIFLGSKK